MVRASIRLLDSDPIVFAWVATACSDHQAVQVVIPAFTVRRPRLDRKVTVAQGQNRLIAVGLKRHFDDARSGRNGLAFAFPSPAEHHFRVRINRDE